MTVAIDWDDIQGNVLRGYGFDHAHHLLFSVVDPAAAGRWLEQILPQVTPATPWTTRPLTTLNVAFTHRGLAALGVDDDVLESFPTDFREGMRARAEDHLGDVGADSPTGWEPAGAHHPAVHVLFMVHARSAEAGETRGFLLASEATEHGLTLVASERLGALRAPPTGANARAPQLEHFGFVDGISQPAVEGALEPTTVPGNGTPLSRGRWRPVRAGEFVLGYPDEEEHSPPVPTPEALVRNGSYLVYRKLAQDVAAFRRATARLADRHRLAPTELAAKLVGRHADGAPLVPPARGGSVPAGPNDFRYRDDRRGRGCPVASHIRRANPRDGFGLKPELVSRHRLLRRGMPYGPPLAPEATDDDGVPRGLVFMAYCASIRRQFEFVQRAWMNDGNAFGAGHTPDPIAGHGAAPRRYVFEVPGRPPVFLAGLPRLVRSRGGDYLFQPGLRGLRFIARCRGD
ncbi:MAG: Dyp-type peroxidase [Acidimicrobiales bacterium]